MSRISLLAQRKLMLASMDYDPVKGPLHEAGVKPCDPSTSPERVEARQRGQ